MGVEGADRAVGEFGELRDARFRHHCGATGTVGSNGTVVTGEIGTLEAAKPDATVTRAGASNDDKPETLHGAGDEFAVEAAADEAGDAEVAEAPGTGKQRTMPEGKDCRRRHAVAGSTAGLRYIFVREGGAKTADSHACDAGDDSEGNALLQGVGGCHS